MTDFIYFTHYLLTSSVPRRHNSWLLRSMQNLHPYVFGRMFVNMTQMLVFHLIYFQRNLMQSEEEDYISNINHLFCQCAML